jgi:cytochrome c oxidase cbb3-type subunit 3
MLILLALAACCQREDRSQLTDPATEGQPVPQSGAAAKAAAVATAATAERYAGNAYQIGEGQRLYRWMNCAGCHGPQGGGGMGPPLMDDQWRYGSGLAEIVRTIDGGRPNGMPSFHDRLTGQQMWQLAAYVRTLSGLARKDAVSSRNDSLGSTEPFVQIKPETPPAGTSDGR